MQLGFFSLSVQLCSVLTYKSGTSQYVKVSLKLNFFFVVNYKVIYLLIRYILDTIPSASENYNIK